MLREDMLECAHKDKKKELNDYILRLEYKFIEIKNLLEPLRTVEYSELNDAYDISLDMKKELY
jgi:hypothetical protein|tara:strand:- start:2753 stop:2941 length:189 start_codon:yes stop_codon:yes gene_type:complete